MDKRILIKGNRTTGEILSIKQTSDDPDGNSNVNLSYEWQTTSQNGSYQTVSNDRLYKVKYEDLSNNIRAVISYTDNEGFNETFISDSIQIHNNSLINPYYSQFSYNQRFGTDGNDNLYGGNNEILLVYKDMIL